MNKTELLQPLFDYLESIKKSHFCSISIIDFEFIQINLFPRITNLQKNRSSFTKEIPFTEESIKNVIKEFISFM